MNKLINVSSLIIFLILGCNRDKRIDSFNVSSIHSYQKISTSMFSKGTGVSGSVEFNVGEKKRVMDWDAYISDDNQLSFSIPSDWRINDDPRTLLFCEIGGTEESYFALLTHDKKVLGVTLDEYKTLLVEEIKSDTVELFDITELSQVNNEDRVTYFLHTNSVKNQVNNESYTLLTENKNYILDFSMRLSGADIDEMSKVIFNVLIHSFKINEIPILNNDAEFVEINIGVGYTDE